MYTSGRLTCRDKWFYTYADKPVVLRRVSNSLTGGQTQLHQKLYRARRRQRLVKGAIA